jgi:prepilin-type N-terminal cleavage/methylation domain-containing protein
MSRRRGAWQHEHGFTLVEVLATIIIMGIVFAIASSTWFGVVESRRVDSSTNQMVSELRRAHTSSTNRLQDWKVELQANSRDYSIGPCPDLPDPDPCAAPLDPDDPLTSERSLEERTEVQPSGGGMVQRVVFEPNGEAQITGAGRIRIAAEDDSPCHEIEINELTSRIRVLTNVCP